MTFQVLSSQIHNHQCICSRTKTIRKINRIHPAVKYMSTQNTAILSVMVKPMASLKGCAEHHQPSELCHDRNSWIDFFLNYIPNDHTVTQAQRQQQINELKEVVRKEFLDTIMHKPKLKQLELLDDIQRLGLAYHFEYEIDEALNQIYETCHYSSDQDNNLEDLYHASLRFRLLRRYGFHVPCDIFKQFLDANGHFKASLSSDVKGMLSLYEASYLGIHGEDILDQALAFTRTRLKLMKNNKLAADHHPLMAKVAHALEQPLHQGVARLESRHYISLYEQNPDHNKVLLKFAKLDFNFLQSLHKEELADLTRWWFYDLDMIGITPFEVRSNLVVVNYFGGFGLMDERPEYALGRNIYFKLVMVGAVLDDLYDLCDIADLQLLTEAFQRWDKQCANQLPNSLKLGYSKVLDAFEDVEKQLAKEGRLQAYPFLVESFEKIWIFHLQFSKWYKEEYVPTFEDYMTTALRTLGIEFCITIGCLGLKEYAKHEVFEWVQQFPKPMQAFATICRLEDDIAEDDLV